jgi:sugar lactone lactonase YvrE
MRGPWHSGWWRFAGIAGRRARRACALFLASATLAVTAWGCGASYPLPTEHRAGRTVAGAGTYQMITTRRGLAGIRDILLTPSGELFLLFRSPGRVLKYPPGLNAPLSTTFPGLQNPAEMAFGANQLFVLDQGDTAAARITLGESITYLADCGPILGFSRPIADLSKYWRVQVYQLNGASLGSFTDTLFLWVNGIAADAVGRVYVSGTIVYCNVDPFDSRIRTFDSQYRIYRYERGAAASGTVIGDGWGRDTSYAVVEGAGIGSTKDPRGMLWSLATGSALYFADAGNQEVQKFADPTSAGSSFKVAFGGSGADDIHLSSPVDVSVDADGYLYVADLGNKRVLRYDPNGSFVQKVNIERDAAGDTLEGPVAVTADNEQVYVADSAHAGVVRYLRRK